MPCVLLERMDEIINRMLLVQARYETRAFAKFCLLLHWSSHISCESWVLARNSCLYASYLGSTPLYVWQNTMRWNWGIWHSARTLISPSPMSWCKQEKRLWSVPPLCDYRETQSTSLVSGILRAGPKIIKSHLMPFPSPWNCFYYIRHIAQPLWNWSCTRAHRHEKMHGHKLSFAMKKGHEPTVWSSYQGHSADLCPCTGNFSADLSSKGFKATQVKHRLKETPPIANDNDREGYRRVTSGADLEQVM